MNAIAAQATKNVVYDPRRDFLAISGRSTPAASTDVLRPGCFPNDVVLAPGQNGEALIRQPAVASFEERLFDALVSLKVSGSFLAMHLSAEERRRLFEALDDTINVEDWHEDDKLPTADSFQAFLRWMIYSRNVDWTSIGVSETGTILVAWRTRRGLLTADFESANSVRWTAKLVGDEGEVGHSAGRCPLRLFAEQAGFYLRR